MDEITHKICLKCKEDLPISNFYFRKEKGQYRGCCKKCKSINTKEEVAARLLAETKVCKHCGIDKPVSEYQKAGKGKWLQPYCKPCDANRKRKHIEENKEMTVNSRKRYYKENKPIIIERTKEYRRKNIDKIKNRAKSYRDKNSDTIKKRNREYGKKNRKVITKKLREKRQSNKEYYQEKGRILRASRTPEQIEAKKKYDREYKIKNKEKNMIFGYLSQFWNSVTSATTDTVAWFQSVGNAVAGALGNLVLIPFRGLFEVILALGWTIVQIVHLVGVIFSPIVFLGIYLYKVSVSFFFTPVTTNLFTLDTSVMTFITAFPLMAIMFVVLTGLLYVVTAISIFTKMVNLTIAT